MSRVRSLIESFERSRGRRTLAEAMQRPADLEEVGGVVKMERPRADELHVMYASPDGEEWADKGDGPVHGSVYSDRAPVPLFKTGPCMNAWIVGMSGARSGWGPMLYDVTLEYASQNGPGLTADRHTVSGSARKVWETYLEGRSDVEERQLDNLENELTPERFDNCRQDSAYDRPPGFPDSALSKLYHKSGTPVIDELRSRDLLIDRT